MATTAIWKVGKRLDKVIKYTTNAEKTTSMENGESWYRDLHNTVEYAKADFKTEEQIFVTGVNFDIDTVLQEMIATKKKFGKEKGILAYHAFQSFAEGEVTPEIAHEIGVKLAEELWGDRFEVIVSTHLNTNHIHNHFVLNSVSFVDGGKYRDNRESYALMRKTSDDLCKEYNLSVLKPDLLGKRKIDYSRYYSSYIQKADYYCVVKEDIDFAIKQAYSYKNFESILKKMGYTITIRANKISLCRPPYKRNIRIERAFGQEYTIRNIEERIMATEMERVPFPEAYSKFKKYKSKKEYQNYKKIKVDRGSLYRLYLYYCYLLKVFPKNMNRTKMSDSMKKEIKKLDQTSDEIKFLCRNDIKTTKELFSYKNALAEELNILFKERLALRRKKYKEENPEQKQKICDEILVLSSKINYLKSEVGICERIEKRTVAMKNNIKEIEEKENEKRKERSRNEYGR